MNSIEVTVKLKLEEEDIRKIVDVVTDQRCIMLNEIEGSIQDFIKDSIDCSYADLYYSGHLIAETVSLEVISLKEEDE